MKAVSCNQSQQSVVDNLELMPDKGHVLLDVLRRGICGSGFHFLTRNYQKQEND